MNVREIQSSLLAMVRSAWRIPTLVAGLMLLIVNTAYADIPPPRPPDPGAAGASTSWVTVIGVMVLVVVAIIVISVMMRRARLRRPPELR